MIAGAFGLGGYVFGKRVQQDLDDKRFLFNELRRKEREEEERRKAQTPT